MQARGSPFWGVLMGALGLTFVLVAVFLGVIAGRDGQPPPEAGTAAPSQADPGEVAPLALDAGSALAAPPADAAPPEVDDEDAGAADAEAPKPAGAPSLGKKLPVPVKPKPKPRPRHH